MMTIRKGMFPMASGNEKWKPRWKPTGRHAMVFSGRYGTSIARKPNKTIRNGTLWTTDPRTTDQKAGGSNPPERAIFVG